MPRFQMHSGGRQGRLEALQQMDLQQQQADLMQQQAATDQMLKMFNMSQEQQMQPLRLAQMQGQIDASGEALRHAREYNPLLVQGQQTQNELLGTQRDWAGPNAEAENAQRWQNYDTNAIQQEIAKTQQKYLEPTLQNQQALAKIQLEDAAINHAWMDPMLRQKWEQGDITNRLGQQQYDFAPRELQLKLDDATARNRVFNRQAETIGEPSVTEMLMLKERGLSGDPYINAHLPQNSKAQEALDAEVKKMRQALFLKYKEQAPMGFSPEEKDQIRSQLGEDSLLWLESMKKQVVDEPQRTGGWLQDWERINTPIKQKLQTRRDVVWNKIFGTPTSK